ncbi:hypothetical protein AURDEDRAFT_165489 [Auricularia subglabra TFB-10046 SS5]|nr:hypothetical protein AURDEDRAFT_165489 [Auricularia subglabra TFB-10046 SS5]
MAEILIITHKNAGFHANASKAQPEQIKAFNLAELARKLRQMAPKTWDLFSSLIDARGSVRRAKAASTSAPAREEWIVGTQDIGGHFDLITIADEQAEADLSDDENDYARAAEGNGVHGAELGSMAMPPCMLNPLWAARVVRQSN